MAFFILPLLSAWDLDIGPEDFNPRDDISRGLMTRAIWKRPCINLFIAYLARADNMLLPFPRGQIKRLLHYIFHIGPGISPRLPYQARQRSYSADMGRGLIPGTIWKISCHNLFITYFTLTFSKHWLLYCKKDLWTDKLRK
jgi:hypothetical protein